MEATDFRAGQKLVLTIALEDKGQDFIELDVLENGVLLGDSVMFRGGRLTLLGIGTLDGMEYQTREQILQLRFPMQFKLAGQFVYFKDTEEKDPLPWKAQTLKYAVIGFKEPKNADRFLGVNYEALIRDNRCTACGREMSVEDARASGHNHLSD